MDDILAAPYIKGILDDLDSMEKEALFQLSQIKHDVNLSEDEKRNLVFANFASNEMRPKLTAKSKAEFRAKCLYVTLEFIKITRHYIENQSLIFAVKYAIRASSFLLAGDAVIGQGQRSNGGKAKERRGHVDHLSNHPLLEGEFQKIPHDLAGKSRNKWAIDISKKLVGTDSNLTKETVRKYLKEYLERR
jgi:hypothetical protein